MENGLTLTGWIFVVVAWSAIISLNIFCFGRILGGRKKDNQKNNPNNFNATT